MFVIFLLFVISIFCNEKVCNAVPLVESNNYEIREKDGEVYLLNLDSNANKAKEISANLSFPEWFSGSYYEDADYVFLNAKYQTLGDEELVGTNSFLALEKEINQAIVGKVLLYGDVNGDGKINAIDSLAVVKNKTEKVLFEDEIYIEAGRVTENTRKNNLVPSAVDALAISKSKLGKYEIEQYRDMLIEISSVGDLYEALKYANCNIVFNENGSQYEELSNIYTKMKTVVDTYCKESMAEDIRALILHDYLITHSIAKTNESIISSASNESGIKNFGGTLNSLGFANSYMCLLGIAGIRSEVYNKSSYTSYATDNKAVNQVIIDGEKYYVSCYQDGLIYGKTNTVSRKYFLNNNTNNYADTLYSDILPKTQSIKYVGKTWPEYRENLDY